MSVSLTTAGPSAADSRFSYAEVDAAAAAVARDAAEIIQGVHRQAIQEIGRSLLRAKDAMPYGAFTRWLHDVVGLPPTTAGNYMRVARLLDGRPATVADLRPTVLYALASPSAPAEVVQAVVDAAAAGETLDAGRIERQLEAAKRAGTELKAAQKRSPGLTREVLADRKAKAARVQARQIEADQAARTRQEQEMQDTLRPLADAILASPGDLAARLAMTLANYSATRALLAMLEAVLREAQP